MPARVRKTCLPLLVAGSLAVGCSATSDSRRLAMTVVIPNVLMTDQPNTKFEVFTESVLANVYEPLVTLDPDMRMVPCLAESWENPSRLVWRFHLRHGVRFHGGGELTAEDVRASIEAVRANPHSDFVKQIRHIKNVTVVDPYTIELSTDTPHNVPSSLLFLRILSSGQNGSAAGTGPYQLVEWKPGSSMRLESFGGYWRGIPAFADVRILFAGSAASRLEMMLGGRADLAVELPLDRLSEVRNSGDYALMVRRGIGVAYVAFDVGRGVSPGVSGRNPFLDERVRQAVALSVDRHSIIEETLHGFGSEAWQIFPPDIFGYTPRLHAPARDLLHARELLAEAGFPAGFKTRLDVGENRTGMGQQIARQLGEAGIQVEVVTHAGDGLIKLLESYGSSMYLIGWTCDSGDGQDILDFCFHVPTSPDEIWLGNAGHYKDDELNAVLMALSGKTDQRERLELLGVAAEIVGRQFAWVPIVIEHQTYGVSKRLDFSPRADGRIELFEIRPSGEQTGTPVLD